MLRKFERPPMKRRLLLFVLLFAGILLPAGGFPARAGETAIWRASAHNQTLPFPRGERAQSVWASGACWSDCGSHCTWGIAACLARDAQGHCLKLGNTCDRYCQRQCRTSSGPLLADIFDALE
jgi:hypothetical protein